MAEIKKRNTLTIRIVEANLVKVTKAPIQSLLAKKKKALG